MKRFFRKFCSYDIRKDAAVALENDIVDRGFHISEKAVEIAEENNRCTIRGSDIREAVRRLD